MLHNVGCCFDFIIHIFKIADHNLKSVFLDQRNFRSIGNIYCNNLILELIIRNSCQNLIQIFFQVLIFVLYLSAELDIFQLSTHNSRYIIILFIGNFHYFSAFAEDNIFAIAFHNRGRRCFRHMNNNFIEQLLIDFDRFNIRKGFLYIIRSRRRIIQQQIIAGLYLRSTDNIRFTVSGMSLHLNFINLKKHRKRQGSRNADQYNNRDKCQQYLFQLSGIPAGGFFILFGGFACQVITLCSFILL